jgi:ferredoxin/flavodoxin---NADP+ reductase
VRRLEDLVYLPVHRRLMHLFPHYRYVGVATREPDSPGHRLQVMLENGALEASSGIPVDPERSRLFLCGNFAMLGRPRLENGARVFPQPVGMIELLEQRGFHADAPDGRLHFERYG